ncbi:hypothetical protein GCM10010182_67300 [Actinomadura cremea]|nr:hypothetical protein GCM10010182_67300 [Actinomadura cremea]
MNTIDFTAPMSDGTLTTITGYPTPTPGLVVHRSVAPNCLPAQDGDACWAVTHVRSGMGMPFCWGSPEGALAFAEEMGRYEVWQQDAEALARSMADQARTIRGDAERLAGRPHPLARRVGPFIDNGVLG